MNKRLSTASVMFFIFLVLIHLSPAIKADEDITALGVSVGDSFIFVIDKNNGGDTIYRPAYNVTTDIQLEVNEHEEFSVTVTNTTVNSEGYFYSIGAEFSNSTYSMLSDLDITVVGLIAFVDWDFYLNNFTVELQNDLDNGNVDSFEIINGADEFRIKTNTTISDSIDAYQEYRYDKTTGVQLYSHVIVGDSVLILRQKGYVVQGEVISDSSAISSTSTSTDSLKSPPTTTGGLSSTNSDNSTSSQSESDATPFVPGFEFFISFTALIATITLLRYKKH